MSTFPSYAMYVLWLTLDFDSHANTYQTLHKHQKVDDDDGHYMVTANTQLTERCKFSLMLG
jgi:hypothetical protein